MPSFKDKIESMWRGEENRSPISKLLGFELVDYKPGEALFTILITKQHWSLLGFAYGSVLSCVAEAAIGIAFGTTLNEEEGFTIIDLHSQFFRPVAEDRIDVKAKLIERGKTIGYVECEIFNSSNKLIAKIKSTCMVIRKK